MNKLNPDDTNSEMKNIAKACYFSAVSTASGIVGGIFEKALAKKFTMSANLHFIIVKKLEIVVLIIKIVKHKT